MSFVDGFSKAGKNTFLNCFKAVGYFKILKVVGFNITLSDKRIIT